MTAQTKLNQIHHKEMMLRLVIMFCGLTIAHLGVTLFLLADLGSDPFNVLIQGIFRKLSVSVEWSFLSHGRIHMAICFLIILVLLTIDKTYIKVGTILCMFCGGPIIDVFTALIQNHFNSTSSFTMRITGLICGCVILAYGMTIVMKADAGVGPNDLVAIVLSDKTKKPFSIIRIIVDACFVLIGFLLGGSVGAGTIICVFIIGPVAGLFLPVNGKIVNYIVRKIIPD